MFRQSAEAGARDVRPIRLLDADPDLAAGLDAADFEEARDRAVVVAFGLEPGAWIPDSAGRELPGDLLGLYVASGVLMRSESVALRSGSELVGAGDFLRPWPCHDVDSSVPSRTTWQVLDPAVVAYLDRNLPARVARWPEIIAALFDRAVERARIVSFQIALRQVRRIDQRLLLLLWRLADRWGRVQPRGVVLPLPLTHGTLSKLVGAQRPTVTTAVRKLTRDGELVRLADGAWLLTGRPPSVDTDIHLAAMGAAPTSTDATPQPLNGERPTPGAHG